VGWQKSKVTVLAELLTTAHGTFAGNERMALEGCGFNRSMQRFDEIALRNRRSRFSSNNSYGRRDGSLPDNLNDRICSRQGHRKTHANPTAVTVLVALRVGYHST
jgi:hypothetical protein